MLEKGLRGFIGKLSMDRSTVCLSYGYEERAQGLASYLRGVIRRYLAPVLRDLSIRDVRIDIATRRTLPPGPAHDFPSIRPRLFGRAPPLAWKVGERQRTMGTEPYVRRQGSDGLGRGGPGKAG